MGKSPRSKPPQPPEPTVAFVARGCAKALVDSERILADLGQAGLILTDQPSQADVIVINTCGFLATARDEAITEIRRAARYKRTGRCTRLVVVGCLVQRDGEKLRQAVPEIDVLVGVHQRHRIALAALGDGPTDYLSDRPQPIDSDSPRLRITPRHYAYLRISEGCSQKCTFCAIPAIRGPIRSKPPEMVLSEARELIADGAAELIVIGQETTSYGRDIDYQPGLAGLLRQLDGLPGLRWLRLMYAYPLTFDQSIIDAIAECPRLVKYIDLPIQHIDDQVLRAMGRRLGRTDTEALLSRLRRTIPHLNIRTTMLVGFPGETDRQFNELLEFVKAFRFDALGAFAFSAEPGTPAADLPHQVPDQLRQQRLDQLMLTQQQIAFELAAARNGQQFDVLVDSADADRPAVARHAGQAPEIDAVTYVQDADLTPGQFLHVTCIGSDQYDLIARPSRDTL